MRPLPHEKLSQRVNIPFKRLPGLNVCGYIYHTWPRPSFTSNIILEERRSCLTPMIKERYQLRDKNDLWVSVTANPMVAKKIIRSTLQRRLRAAFKEVLQEKGYTVEGRNAQDRTVGLAGSLQLFALSPLLQTGHQELKQQMAILLRSMKSQMDKSSSRNP